MLPARSGRRRPGHPRDLSRAPVRQGRDVLVRGAVGVDTPAHIDSMTSTGKTDAPGGTEYVIALTVKPASGEAYQAQINQYVYPSNPFSEGQDVNVKVDPEDPTS